MRTTIQGDREIAITHIKLTLPILYGEEDVPNDFPLRNLNVWSAFINIDTGQIVDWPINPRFQQCVLRMKVRDSGIYTLYRFYNDYLEKISEIYEDYVPHGVVPGEYGDYVELIIDNGIITNWPKNPDVSAFF